MMVTRHEQALIHEVMEMAYEQGIEEGKKTIGSMEWLQKKVERQRQELKRLNNVLEERGLEEAVQKACEVARADAYAIGFEHGKEAYKGQVEAVNITVSKAYQEGVEEGKKQALEAIKEKAW